MSLPLRCVTWFALFVGPQRWRGGGDALHHLQRPPVSPRDCLWVWRRLHLDNLYLPEDDAHAVGAGRACLHWLAPTPLVHLPKQWTASPATCTNESFAVLASYLALGPRGTRPTLPCFPSRTQHPPSTRTLPGQASFHAVLASYLLPAPLHSHPAPLPLMQHPPSARDQAHGDSPVRHRAGGGRAGGGRPGGGRGGGRRGGSRWQTAAAGPRPGRGGSPRHAPQEGWAPGPRSSGVPRRRHVS